MKMRNQNQIHSALRDIEGIGVVEKVISAQARGRVSYNGSHWFATLFQADGRDVLQQGEVVRVIGREGITLIVSSLS